MMARGGGFHGRQLTPRPGDDQPINPKTLRRVAGFFKPYRRQVGITVFAILVTAVLGLINPYLLKLLIDDAIPNRDLDKLYLYVGLMIAIPIVTGLIGVGQTYLNTVIGQRVMRDLRDALYRHLQRLPLRFFTATRTGEIQSRLSNDVGGVQQVVTDTATSIVNNVAVALSTIVAMWLLNWQLALLSLGLLPFFLILTYKVGAVRRELAGTTQRTIADMTALIEETLSVSGVLLTKVFGRQDYQAARFQDENTRLAGLQVRQQMVGRWFFMIIGTFFSITPAFVYLLAGSKIIHGDNGLTIGDIVAFTTLQSRLFFPVGQLLGVQVEIQGALALFDRIFEYLDLPTEISDRPNALTLDPATVRGKIRFDDVSFHYDELAPVALAAVPSANGRDKSPDVLDGLESSETQAINPIEVKPFTLNGIDFELQPGQLAALVGPSGSGKTTISLLVPRLYDVTSGVVSIDDIDVRDISLASLGEIIGMVTQETYLFHATIRENIAYGRLGASEEDIIAATKAAALHDRIMQLPDGYDTVVGERGYRLSGGEKQRIAIARVILKDPRILILDEATSALDTHSERLIQSALEPLMAGRTTIAIAHRLSTILAADQILVIERGHIVERGTHRQLLALNGLYARLFREQFAAGMIESSGAVETIEEAEIASPS
ncbi:MAG: ABC transporter ATP-binding protein [Thermomicrobiales bacterium]